MIETDNAVGCDISAEAEAHKLVTSAEAKKYIIEEDGIRYASPPYGAFTKLKSLAERSSIADAKAQQDLKDLANFLAQMVQDEQMMPDFFRITSELIAMALARFPGDEDASLLEEWLKAVGMVW